MDRSERRTRLRRLTAGVPRALRALLSARSGAIGIIVVVAIPVLGGFAGLAIDVGYWYMARRDLQNAADVGAVSGALEIIRGNDDTAAVAAAKKDAERNGADPNKVAVTTAYAGDAEAVEVIISQPQPLFFLSLLNVDPIEIKVRAVAKQGPGGPQPACILALDPSAPNALKLDSNAKINAPGCAVQSDSTDNLALTVNSSTRIEGGTTVDAIRAAGVCVTGAHVDQGGGITPEPLNGVSDCPPLGDPLILRDPPTFGGCDYTDTKFVDGVIIEGIFTGGTAPSVAATPSAHPVPSNCSSPIAKITLSPGVYCNGLYVEGCSNVEFLPGEYIISDGLLEIENNAYAKGDGIGFYLTGANPSAGTATVYFDSNSVVDFVAPSSGAMAGIVFWEDRDAPVGQIHELDSNGTMDFEGILYFSKGQIHLDSNSLASTNSPYTKIIGRTINLDSNAVLTLNDRHCSEVPPPCSNLPVPPGFSVKTGQKVLLTE